MNFPASPTVIPTPPGMPPNWPTDAINVWLMLVPVREALDQNVERENGEAVAYHLVDLQSLIGTTAGALSQMSAIRDGAHLKVLEALGQDPYTPKTASLQRDYVNAKLANYEAAFLYAERMNAGITHAIDAMRSILSWIKSERQTYTLPNNR